MIPIGCISNRFSLIVSLDNMHLFYKKLFGKYSFSQKKNKNNKLIGNNNIIPLSKYPFTSFTESYKAGQIVQKINPDLISIGLSDSPFY